ncbi:MAG: FG-GAP repeat protein, partial [Acidobacteriota bacterium]
KNLEFQVDLAPAPVRLTRILGPRSGAIGSDTAAQGDFDGDGMPDLMIGSPDDSPQGRREAGTIHILFGQDSHWPALIDTAPGQLPPKNQLRIAEIHGARGAAAGDRGDVLCYSGAAGDIDGDGRDDIISNEMVGNGLAENALDVGNLIIISGRALLPPRPARNRPMRVRPRK